MVKSLLTILALTVLLVGRLLERKHTGITGITGIRIIGTGITGITGITGGSGPQNALAALNLQ